MVAPRCRAARAELARTPESSIYSFTLHRRPHCPSPSLPIVDDFPPLSTLWDNVPVLRVQGNWGSLTPAKLEQQLEHWLANTDFTYSISKAFLPYWLAQLRL